MLGNEDTPYGNSFLLGKTGLLDKELPLTKLWKINTLSKWTSRTQEKKILLNFAKTGKDSRSNFPASENDLSDIL